MTEILGSGEHSYRMLDAWAQIEGGPLWPYDIASISIDSNDNVYAFTRGPHPIMIFDREGRFLRSWGEGLFGRPHGSHIAADGYIYLTDDAHHVVRKFTLDGKLLLTIGVPEKPAPFMSNLPFNRCTHTALSPSGEIFVADGYGNAALHKYTDKGVHLATWGECGTDP